MHCALYRVRKMSVDTLDIEDYLSPTFDKLDVLNPRDLTPPSEAPPPIPTVSYARTPNTGRRRQGSGGGGTPNVTDASWS